MHKTGTKGAKAAQTRYKMHKKIYKSSNHRKSKMLHPAVLTAVLSVGGGVLLGLLWRTTDSLFFADTLIAGTSIASWGDASVSDRPSSLLQLAAHKEGQDVLAAEGDEWGWKGDAPVQDSPGEPVTGYRWNLIIHHPG